LRKNFNAGNKVTVHKKLVCDFRLPLAVRYRFCGFTSIIVDYLLIFNTQVMVTSDIFGIYALT
ncbi:MAG: hypothetical protein II931_04295, partial [Clostridia bacterium]|nr:hypothetical protein [Clostridia bacterium]